LTTDNSLGMKSIDLYQKIESNDEWGTDPEDLEKICEKWNLDLRIDAFSSDRNYKFSTFYTKKNSVFLHQMKQDFFANPPYSIIERCVKFCYYQSFFHNVNCLLLVFAKTETKWFQRYIWRPYLKGQCELEFIEGRLKFLKNGIPSKNDAPFGSCWVLYRNKGGE